MFVCNLHFQDRISAHKYLYIYIYIVCLNFSKTLTNTSKEDFVDYNDTYDDVTPFENTYEESSALSTKAHVTRKSLSA